MLPIARFLRLTHRRQALGLDDASAGEPGGSVLSPLLPEAMVGYLDTYGPEEFSKVRLTPPPPPQTTPTKADPFIPETLE